MNRRGFLGMSLAAAGMVFAPKFGRWHRQGSGLLVPDAAMITWPPAGILRIRSMVVYDQHGTVISRARITGGTGEFMGPVRCRLNERLEVVIT